MAYAFIMYYAPVNSGHNLCTQMTASTMPDFSISIATVVTIPVHWAPAIKENEAKDSYYSNKQNQTIIQNALSSLWLKQFTQYTWEIIYTICDSL